MKRRAWLGVLGLVVACGNSSKSVATTSDAGQTPDASAGGGPGDAGVSLASACGHYFDVAYGGKCHAPTIPADELARIRPRYVTWCVSDGSRPGRSGGASALAACADALATSECEPAACVTSPGTLPAGTIVNGRDQCQSGNAEPLATTADAGLTFPVCGTCDALIPLGQPCANLPSASCGWTALCSRQSNVCVAAAIGGLGASCGTESELCGVGSYCGPNQTCIALGRAGDSCSQSLRCAATLHCAFAAPTAETGTCQNGAALGMACSSISPCAPGLACSAAGSCAAITYAAAGQPCSELATCLSGTLDYCPFAQNSLAGTCPRVIADGEPCDLNDPTTACDTFAGCQNGTCTLTDVLCK